MRERRVLRAPRPHQEAGGLPDEAALATAHREGLRHLARAILGVSGKQDDERSLRTAIAESGAGWYPLVALSLLVVVDEFQAAAFAVLGPEIAGTLGLSKAQLGAMIAIKTLAVTVAALPMAAVVQRGVSRASLSIVTAFAWSALTGATAFVSGLLGLLLVLVGDGASTGSVRAVHNPLLLDSYPPAARVRVLSGYRGANNVGNVLAPALVAVCTVVFHLTWRGVFLAMGVMCVVAAVSSVRLRDPGIGRLDSARVREALRAGTGDDGAAAFDEVTLGFWESIRRLLLIPTIRRVLAALAVLGMLLVPLQTFLFFFLDERWGMGPGERALFSAGLPLFSIAALSLFGPLGERLFREDPAKVVRLSGVLLAAAVVAMALAIAMPFFVGMVLLFGIAFGAVAALGPALGITLLSIIPAQVRSHAAAIEGVTVAAVGGFGGLVLLGGLDRRFGTGGAIGSLLVPGLIGALLLRSAARTVNDDLDQMIDAIVEEEVVRADVRAGKPVPLLACRGIDFSYGQLQVLFDVDFTVDEGEMVALLGTNGAGKSTLLRVISGLGMPSRGSVRLGGIDVTHLDAHRRVGLGICQIPGGRAVFGAMSVAENLRVLGHSFGTDRRRVQEGIDVALDAFPRLAERLDQPAMVLSGGEQQMLGLATALVLRPRVLLIDELSLGLAPAIVGELLDMVRRIRDGGTAVVLVEQSVNVALSLVDHAYFMEKGQVRFDGRAADLIGRDDLLRSVFLEGATKAIGPRRS